MTHFHLERLSFFHPGAKKKIVVRAPVERDYGAGVLDGQRNVIRSLHTAMIKRLPCINELDTNCFRLISGPAEDVPGIVAEKYGDIVVLEISWLFDRMLQRVEASTAPQPTYPVLGMVLRLAYLSSRALDHLRHMDFSTIPGFTGYVLSKSGLISAWLRLTGKSFPRPGPRRARQPDLATL